jgi:tight adherence protein B
MVTAAIATAPVLILTAPTQAAPVLAALVLTAPVLTAPVLAASILTAPVPAAPMPAALACATLAVAIACLPGSTARARLGVLAPRPRPRPRWPRAVAPALLGGLAGLLLMGPGGAVAGALAVGTLRRGRLRRRVAAAAIATSDQLADALRRMTDELRAGSHPVAVLAGVAADGPLARGLLGGAATAAALGVGVPTALRHAAAGVGLDGAGLDGAGPGGAGGSPVAGATDRGSGSGQVRADIERIAVAWALAERHGIPLAELLARAHEDIRWRVRFGATVRAQLAGPRATAAILTALPALGLGLGQLIGADPIGVLRGGALGQLLLVAGIGLAAAGMAWSERILRSAVPQ